MATNVNALRTINDDIVQVFDDPQVKSRKMKIKMVQKIKAD